MRKLKLDEGHALINKSYGIEKPILENNYFKEKEKKTKLEENFVSASPHSALISNGRASSYEEMFLSQRWLPQPLPLACIYPFFKIYNNLGSYSTHPNECSSSYGI